MQTIKHFQYFDILSRPGSALGEGKSKPMSAAFEPHMGIFVDAQDKYGICCYIVRQ